MIREDRTHLLSSSEITTHNNFKELTLTQKGKITDIVFAKIEVVNPRAKRKYKLLKEIELLLPHSCKHLVTTLEKTIKEIETIRIKRAILFTHQATKKDFRKLFHSLEVKEYARKYLKAHYERERERKRKWREKNIEEINEREKRYRENNLEKIKDTSRRYRKNNPQKIKEGRRRFKENNPEYYKKYYVKKTKLMG